MMDQLIVNITKLILFNEARVSQKVFKINTIRYIFIAVNFIRTC